MTTKIKTAIIILILNGFLFASVKGHQANYPEFSCDTVPVFHHTAKLESLYSEQEAEFIANNFPIIVLEKMHAQNDPKYKYRSDKASFVSIYINYT